jgi:hypothetical protein
VRAGEEPLTVLDARFSTPGATATEWAFARRPLEEAKVFWLSTVRPDGRPHVTPLISVLLDGALYFRTGPSLDEGLDLVVEGDAVKVGDDTRLRRIAAAYESKYGSAWHFEVHDGAFFHERDHEGSRAFVYEVAPMTAFGFRKGDEFSQTRWQF